jgi:hypothetical protein
MEKEHSKRRLLSPAIEPHLRVKLIKCYICNVALHGAEILTLGEEGQKYLKHFEM